MPLTRPVAWGPHLANARRDAKSLCLIAALSSHSEAAFWVVRACRVDVEIDDIDTALRLVVAIAGVPRSIAQANVADLGEPEATPLTSGRQTLVALAAKLISQRFLSPL